jgi:polyferredoxin
VWSLVGVGLLFALFIRPEIDMTVAPVRNPTFIVQSDGTVRNVYDIRLRNKQGEARPFGLSLNSGTNLSIHVEGFEGTLVTVPADEMKQVRVYVDAPKGSPESTSERSPFTFWVTDLSSQDRASVGTIFNGRSN